jgi:hypothetical protein
MVNGMVMECINGMEMEWSQNGNKLEMITESTECRWNGIGMV